MPPLPSTVDSVATQLVSSIRRREFDVTNVQIPRLKACPGPLSLQQNLAAELREDLDALARHIDVTSFVSFAKRHVFNPHKSLDSMVDDQKGQKNRRELRTITEELRESLFTLRKDYRAAMLTSKRAIDTSSLSNRNELFASTTEKSRDTRDVNEKVTFVRLFSDLKTSALTEAYSEDAVMKANNDVTEALQRTLGLMQGELERSVLATQMLDSSIVSLRATSSTHDILSNAMDTSKQLITALEKADWIDRLIIFFGLGVFVLVTLFILKQRIVDRSVRLAFWWTRFLPSGKPLVAVPAYSNSLSLTSTSTAAFSILTTAAASVATSFPSSLSQSNSYDSSASLSPMLASTISTESDMPFVTVVTESASEIESVFESPETERESAVPVALDIHEEL
ncbi:hypothetical protein D9757_004076 [Collybiopsis confluens]|uniref:Sec20 C-terminal domain-containing protein n=1 Tax=Collybiopsis confluens TaxID=2823264 RepID=A0A8H5HUK0_9AGAR|nr:hypothetical protein D9757_004076 [Collybiopsis confluens]